MTLIPCPWINQGESEGLMEIIITIATVVIAFSAIASYLLAMSIQRRDKEYSQQTSDLFQAIVISNILSDPEAQFTSSHLEGKIVAFKELYKGKTTIFLTEENEGK
jgi:hypothetical protein